MCTLSMWVCGCVCIYVGMNMFIYVWVCGCVYGCVEGCEMLKSRVNVLIYFVLMILDLF